jgi:hypothetical protein
MNGPEPGTYCFDPPLSFQFVVFIDAPEADLGLCRAVYQYLAWCKPVVTFKEPTWMLPGDYLTVRRVDLRWYERMAHGSQVKGHTPVSFGNIGSPNEHDRHNPAVAYVNASVPMSQAELTRVIVHETGIAMGLVDRHDDPRLVMHPQGSGDQFTEDEQRTANANLEKLVLSIQFHFFRAPTETL